MLLLLQSQGSKFRLSCASHFLSPTPMAEEEQPRPGPQNSVVFTIQFMCPPGRPTRIPERRLTTNEPRRVPLRPDK